MTMLAPGRLVLVGNSYIAKVVEDLNDTVVLQPVNPDTYESHGPEVEIGHEEITPINVSVIDGEVEVDDGIR